MSRHPTEKPADEHCPLCGKPVLDRHRRRETPRGTAHLTCPRGVDTRKLRRLTGRWVR